MFFSKHAVVAAGLASIFIGSPFAMAQVPGPDIKGHWGLSQDLFAGDPPLVVNFMGETVTVKDHEIGHAVLLPNSNKILVWNPQTVTLTAPDPDIVKGETFRLWIIDPIAQTKETIDLWNPSTNSGLGADLFCAGHTHRKDGKILIGGGNDGNSSVRAYLFDPNGSPNRLVELMNQQQGHGVLSGSRYYPTVITLPDGSSMVIGGTDIGTASSTDAPSDGWDIYTAAATPQWIAQQLSRQWEWYPRLFVRSSGTIFMPFDDFQGSGHYTKKIGSYSLTYSTSQGGPSSVIDHSPWSLGWKWNHYQGSAAMLLQLEPETSNYVDRIFAGFGTPHLPTAHNFGFIDGSNPAVPYVPSVAPVAPDANRDVNEFAFSGASVTMVEKQQPAGSMPLRPRQFANLVILPTGKLLALGGWEQDWDQFQSGSHTPALKLPVYAPEIIDPGANQSSLFTRHEMNPHCHARLYHEVALLLPDGRVLLMGGELLESGLSEPGPCTPPAGHTSERTYELFEPPYMHQGPRPAILGVSSSQLGYGAGFSVETRSSNIGKVVLMRPGSVTHMFDSDQRYVELPFTAGEPTPQGISTLSVTTPPNGNVAPPGWYMLFIVTNPPAPGPTTPPEYQGVPSVATWIHLE